MNLKTILIQSALTVVVILTAIPTAKTVAVNSSWIGENEYSLDLSSTANADPDSPPSRGDNKTTGRHG